MTARKIGRTVDFSASSATNVSSQQSSEQGKEAAGEPVMDLVF